AHAAGHRSLERAGVGALGAAHAFALLVKLVGNALPEQVDGAAIPSVVERPRLARVAHDHAALRDLGEGEAENLAVDADVPLALRRLQLHLVERDRGTQ